MAKMSKTEVDRELRNRVLDDLFSPKCGWEGKDYQVINDRQMGILLTDLNGQQRYVRIGAIVAELREDMTAQELMQSEIDAYNQKQADKAEKAKKKEVKIAKDKARREAEKKKQEEDTDDSN